MKAPHNTTCVLCRQTLHAGDEARYINRPREGMAHRICATWGASVSEDRTGQWWWYQPRGLGAQERRCYICHDKGRRLDVVHSLEQGKTLPIRATQLRSPADPPRSLSGPGLTRQPSYARPEQGVHDVREVAEAVRPRADKRKARKSRSYLDHVKSHACCFAYMGNCRGPMDPHHFPPKRNGDGFGSDYQCAPLCRGHHDEVTERYCVGPLTRAETEAHVLGVMNEILAKYVMRWEAA